jgi:hypothetical protein
VESTKYLKKLQALLINRIAHDVKLNCIKQHYYYCKTNKQMKSLTISSVLHLYELLHGVHSSLYLRIFNQLRDYMLYLLYGFTSVLLICLAALWIHCYTYCTWIYIHIRGCTNLISNRTCTNWWTITRMYTPYNLLPEFLSCTDGLTSAHRCSSRILKFSIMGDLRFQGENNGTINEKHGSIKITKMDAHIKIHVHICGRTKSTSNRTHTQIV